MQKTLLLVFIHGFKGTDQTFHAFPKDLRALVSHSLPKINVVSIIYPQYETRGDLKQCVARFKEWLQNKVIDLEVLNKTPSPTVDPSVHVVLCGHSMGGIVAAETLLSIARDEPVAPSYANDTTNSTTPDPPSHPSSANLNVPEQDDRASSAPPPEQPIGSTLFFPYVQAIIAFDTPYLGISPGVLAHGAEERFNEASTAYKWYDGAQKLFSAGNSTPKPIPNAASRGLPAPSSGSNAWGNWGKYAMYGGAAAAIAGVAGAAYLNWNQINEGLNWAGSHLEFVGTLSRGAELQKRVESVVELTRTHDVGFANFYGALDEKVTNKTKYAGSIVGQDRTFCVVPKDANTSGSPTGTKRGPPTHESPPAKRRKSQAEADMEAEMEQGKQVQDFAQDPSKSKGRWVKCVNSAVGDELTSHTSMFKPDRNPDYHAMLPRARDQILEWVDHAWYESSSEDPVAAESEPEVHAS